MIIYPDDFDCENFREKMIHFFKLVNEQDGEGKIKIQSTLKCLHIIINSIQFFLM